MEVTVRASTMVPVPADRSAVRASFEIAGLAIVRTV